MTARQNDNTRNLRAAEIRNGSMILRTERDLPESGSRRAFALGSREAPRNSTRDVVILSPGSQAGEDSRSMPDTAGEIAAPMLDAQCSNPKARTCSRSGNTVDTMTAAESLYC